MAGHLDQRDADRWWESLPPDRRVTVWRWLTKAPAAPPASPDQGELFTPDRRAW